MICDKCELFIKNTGIRPAIKKTLSSAPLLIKETDQKYTGFEANGRLYQFCRIPFGVTNGVAVFQRAMDRFVEEEGLKDTFPYLDNITVAGRDQKEHDKNVQKFHEAVGRRNLTLNEKQNGRIQIIYQHTWILCW